MPYGSEKRNVSIMSHLLCLVRSCDDLREQVGIHEKKVYSLSFFEISVGSIYNTYDTPIAIVFPRELHNYGDSASRCLGVRPYDDLSSASYPTTYGYPYWQQRTQNNNRVASRVYGKFP